MNAVKVDQAHRIRLPELKPGDYYEPEIGPDADQVTLRRLRSVRPKLTKDQIVQRIRKSPLRFQATWDELRKETREL